MFGVPARHHAPPKRGLSLSALARVALPAVLVAALLLGVGMLALTRRVAPEAVAAAHSSSSAGPTGRQVLAPAPNLVADASTPAGSGSPSTGDPIAAAAARAETEPGTDAIGQVSALVAGLGAGGASVAAVNLGTGATFSYGASSGMTMGSVAKVDILETLLLQRASTHTMLSANEVSLATTMIENSDNNAADALWADLGGAAVIDRVQPAARHTRPGARRRRPVGPGHDLRKLTRSPCSRTWSRPAARSTPPSQQFAISLMQNVEADQRWGVGVGRRPGHHVREQERLAQRRQRQRPLAGQQRRDRDRARVSRS